MCIEQIYIPDGNRGIYRRDQFWGSGWREWRRIYDESILTDPTILSSLASALGVGIPRVRALRNVGVGYIVFSVTNKWAPKEIKILFNRYGVDCAITLAWGSNTELAKYSIVSSKPNTEVQDGLKIFYSETNMAIQIVTGDSWAVAEGVSYLAGMTVNQYESYDTTGMTQIL